MLWENLREEEFEGAIKTSGGLCIIPLGCIEKHGQHLPVGTDMFIARRIIEDATKVEDAMVFDVGAWMGEVSGFHANPTPETNRTRGCIAITQNLMLNILTELCNEIYRNGFNKILLVNAHGGNRPILNHFLRCQSYDKKPYALMWTEANNSWDTEADAILKVYKERPEFLDMLTEEDIKTLENRLKTRFEMGLIADIQPPDFELRIAILKNKSKKMNVKIPDEVLTFIAENLKQNIRQLEGAIKRICAHSFLSGAPITLDMTKECLSAFIGGAESPDVTAKRIVSLVSKRYGVAQDDIYGRKRQQQICHARNVCMYIIKNQLDLSYPAIGKMFNRDHTTILSSCDAIKANLDKNLLGNEINEIIKELNE